MIPTHLRDAEAAASRVRYIAVLIWDEEGLVWVAEVPAVDGAATGNETVEDALETARELIVLNIADMRSHEEALPVESVPVQVHAVAVTDADLDALVTIPHQPSSIQSKQ